MQSDIEHDTKIFEKSYIIELIQVYNRHLNGESNLINEISNHCIRKMISFSLYDYDSYVASELPDLFRKQPKVKDDFLRTLPELLTYSDEDLFFLLKIISYYATDLYQAFNDLSENINKLTLSEDYNEKIKYGRVWIEKFYFDIFKNESTIFRPELIKYLEDFDPKYNLQYAKI